MPVEISVRAQKDPDFRFLAETDAGRAILTDPQTGVVIVYMGDEPCGYTIILNNSLELPTAQQDPTPFFQSPILPGQEVEFLASPRVVRSFEKGQPATTVYDTHVKVRRR